MSLSSPSVLLHKLSQLDMKFLCKMLKVEGWLQRISGAATRGSAITLHSVVARFGWNETVAELMSSGARVSEQDADGNTALHVAFLKFGEALVVDLLMKKFLRETRKNIANKDGLCVVHMVCSRSYTEFLKWVLDGGEQVNVDCKVNQASRSPYAGYTPLHFAVKFEQREVAELLLTRYSANLYEQDAKGSTPVHLALECGDVKMLDLLLAYDRRRENVVNERGLSHFMAACAGTDELAVQEYLQATPSQLQQLIGGTVDHADGYRFAGYAPLHFAVEFDRANVAQLLVEKAREMTPIDLATSQQSSPGDGTPSSSGSDTTELSCARGESNVCVESLCFVCEIFAFAMFLLLLLPNFVF